MYDERSLTRTFFTISWRLGLSLNKTISYSCFLARHARVSFMSSFITSGRVSLTTDTGCIRESTNATRSFSVGSYL